MTMEIWTQNWILRDEMMRLVECLSADPPTLVSELIDVTNGSWNMVVLKQNFLPMDVVCIKSIPLCTRNIPIFLSWNLEKMEGSQHCLLIVW